MKIPLNIFFKKVNRNGDRIPYVLIRRMEGFKYLLDYFFAKYVRLFLFMTFFYVYAKRDRMLKPV